MSDDEEIVIFVEDGPLAGSYVAEYDPWANDRRGEVVGTNQVEQAKGFPSMHEAFKFLMQEAGKRPDGKPNRPLTASSNTFVKRRLARQNHPERRFHPEANS